MKKYLIVEVKDRSLTHVEMFDTEAEATLVANERMRKYFETDHPESLNDVISGEYEDEDYEWAAPNNLGAWSNVGNDSYDCFVTDIELP